jgi:uncharacterized Zn finger protein
MYDGFGWSPYVPVAERRRKVLLKMEKLRKKGRAISPVSIDGRTIVKTFWGKAWCDNLESYSDFSNRLPRGRTYVRNGSVLDLHVAPGQINALVSGSEIYEVKVEILPVSKLRWKSICEDCAGSIDSLIELLQGRLSKGVMERICQQQTGLFPSPKEIKLSCSCPDWAEMCKHVAAVLYGIGARLDKEPELLFRLHQVDEKELIAKAGKSLPGAKKSPSAAKVLGEEDLSKLFGLDIAEFKPESALPAKADPIKKVIGTKARRVGSKTKSPQKAANSTATAKTAAPAKSTVKKKPAVVLTKAQPGKAAALKKSAVNATPKSADSAKKEAIPTTKKKTASVATKAKPTKKTATKTSTAKRSSQTKRIAIQRRGSGRRSAKP